MFSVKKIHLPELALLSIYRDNGAYTDCYSIEVMRDVSLQEYLEAFYTTTLFKLERLILRWIASRPSTDEQVHLLAAGKVESFAAWNVEARVENQIILADINQSTRSWLMCVPSRNQDSNATKLYFGSAVIPRRLDKSGQEQLGKIYQILLPFHKLYSRALLGSAGRRLSQ